MWSQRDSSQYFTVRKFLGNPWFGGVSAAIMIVGLPSTIDSAFIWVEWMEGMASVVMAWIGSILVTAYVVSVGPRGWKAFMSWIRGRHRTEDDPSDNVVDFIGACGIIDSYIAPATRDMRAGIKLTVKQDLISRFDKVTGAKLGEYQYNRALLHQWMQSNAARFLVEHRGEML